MLQLAPWGEDECIEYLLHAHREQCTSVMRRLRDAGDLASLGGVAQLVSAVLDTLAADESALSAAEALDRRVNELLARAPDRAALEALCLQSALEPEYVAALAERRSAAPRFEGEFKLLRHPIARASLAARALLAALERGELPEGTLENLGADVVRCTAPLVRVAPSAIRALLERFESAKPKEAGLVASLLHAADANAFAKWIASRVGKRDKPYQLHAARLSGAPWTGFQLANAALPNCDFSRAALVRCNLSGAQLHGARFQRSDLSGANLTEVQAPHAQFVRAALVSTNAARANFKHADLRHADLSGAQLLAAQFEHANLRFAILRGASLSKSVLRMAEFEETDFTAANLNGADLRGCDFTTSVLREACLDYARVNGATFVELDLSGVSATRADFSEAALYSASLRHAKFADASLRCAGLANLDAEGADFTGADFAGATFRLGTTRSGLVFHAPPMEGTRSGFYSDEFFDSPHRAPEEVRTANLRGATLLGANVEWTDFYLVDLRGALYDARQAQHFRRCGAILRDRER
ncbi:MAG: pentapeptide repeat-containing protein [Planctomycetes bacterium]|nr:pentapeptide repeat-containing protein [Planctomycetota bacterium]